MRAVVFDRPHHYSVTEVDDPRPRPGQVRLRSVATGVCGTDRHLLAGGFMARFPLIPGHEILAEVESLGDEVEELSVGDLVVVDNTVVCGYCEYCRRGQPLYCSNFYSMGVNGPGGFADLLVAQAEKCFPVGGLEPMAAVLTEPLACAMHAASAPTASSPTAFRSKGRGTADRGQRFRQHQGRRQRMTHRSGLRKREVGPGQVAV